MVLYSSDTFDRTDSATDLGDTDGAGSLDPATWVQYNGVWGIASNQAYKVNSTVVSRAGFDFGVADVDLRIELANLSNNEIGLLFRYSDSNNFLYADCTTGPGGDVRLRKRESGSFLEVTTAVNVPSATDGSVLRLRADGSDLRVFLDGVQVMQATETFNASATIHGLFVNTNTPSSRLDNWFAYDPQPLTDIKTMDGLAYSSAKTVNGLAVASIKTINGLS
jgi:hypothetical protein